MNCTSCFPQNYGDAASASGYGEAVQTIQPMAAPGSDAGTQPMMPSMPSMPGITMTPQTRPSMPVSPTGTLTPITPTTEPPAQTLVGNQYLNGALRSQIGQRVTVSYLIGTNTFMDRTGTLLAVGANYIVMQESDTDDILFSDFYSIKFVRVYR